VFTYLSALFTGATQIMLPLVAELSTLEKRAFNISIVGAGPTLGILLARILSGIVTNYTSWRNVYWLALGLQGCVLIALWLFMPDYPATNPMPLRQIVKTYPKILWSIVTLYPKHAVLVQAALLSFCTFFTLTSYWTTLTFLLAGSPYHYNSTDIGLFGLVGLATMLLGPIYGKYLIQPLREPLFSVIVGKTVSLVGIVVGTYTGTHNVAGPIIQALMLDAGLIIVQIANRMAIHAVEPQGRNRVNTAFVSVMYLGQLTGTKAGNEVYEKHGGWIASGSLSVAVIAFSYVIIALRGPYEKGWIGWSGGWGLKPKEKKGDEEEGGCVARASVEMKDIQGWERAIPENDSVDNRRFQTAKDEEEVDGEKGKAPVPESLHFTPTPSDLTEIAAPDGTVDPSLLILPAATRTLQSINEGHSKAANGENIEAKVTS
jgi:predicted MFS family arabinose efflux permease